MPGLMIDGQLVQVEGVRVLSPDEEKWVHLSREDFTTRLNRPQQAILHKTIADDPEQLIPGGGPSKAAGGARYTAEYWQGSKKCSGAHLITGYDGTTACLEDLVKICAWHGNQANLLSYGHEMKEVLGGGIYEDTIRATVAVTLKATRTIGIQWQCPKTFKGPLKRFQNGGTTLVGIFGHREITSNRSRWDPGDEVFVALQEARVERFDFGAGEDLDVWSKRQAWLLSLGVYHGKVDGIPGPRTRAGLLALGYPDGIFAAWRELPEQPPLPPGYSP